jgi:hypothetical protein
MTAAAGGTWYNDLTAACALARAGAALCRLPDGDDYKAYCGRRAAAIRDPATRAAVSGHASVFGDLLVDLETCVNENLSQKRAPEAVRPVRIDLSGYKMSWRKHAVEGEWQSLVELQNTLEALCLDVEARLQALHAGDTGGYSSYSDYSEETSSDEEEDEEVDDEHER